MARFVPTGPFSRQTAQNIERLPGQVLSALGRVGSYLGSNQAATDYTNLLSGNVPSIGRSAKAGPNPLQGDVTGRYAPPFMQRGISSGDIGGDGRSDEERALTSQYAPKPFPLTPQGQFDRYFGGSEMDPYFGAASRGAGAPKDLAAMEALAGKEKAPTDTSLATYYRAQSASGRGNIDEIVSAMGYKGPLADWAKANPMLAQREFNKRFPAGEPTIGPTPGALQADESLKRVTKFFPGAEPEGFAPGVANPVPPTEQKGDYGMTQGEKMDFFRGAPALREFQAAKTSGSSMPAFETTASVGDRTAAFLQGLKR